MYIKILKCTNNKFNLWSVAKFWKHFNMVKNLFKTSYNLYHEFPVAVVFLHFDEPSMFAFDDRDIDGMRDMKAT